MSSMLEDGIDSMMTTFLEQSGTSCVYRNDNGSSQSMTLSRRRQMPQQIETSEGCFVEMMIVDFIGRWDDLPFGEPRKNQSIEVGGHRYMIRPGSSGKCFRQMADAMVRIHTVQVQ